MGQRVMVMAGGTGGHVFPALAVAEWLREQGADLVWLGTRDSFESRVVPERGFKMEWIDIKGVRGSGLLRRLMAPFQLLLALFQAMQVIRRVRPTVVLGMGGFVSGPGGLMACLMGIPLVIQEQNRIPGLTNRLLSRIAHRVFEAFPGSFDSVEAEACGNPVRREIERVAPPQQRFIGREAPMRLLIIGGSLGAQALNETVPAALALLPGSMPLAVRHQCGASHLEATEASYRVAGVQAEIHCFEEDMAEAYGWADLVICRAGALTVSELAAVGLAAVMVPYPHAVDDHQTLNAHFLVDAGAALLLPQSEMDAHSLSAKLKMLFDQPDQLREMSVIARSLAQPAAAASVGKACLQVGIER
ncbi:MAG: undecaprenyldiphospho-muramoylpentapeptide beta-N-acetylglucosaminyltransferase [Candidatus Polarisedimenticolaceae bacterium]|nr:undecaprenyldiphospho-muramoylpentapeptide beta-N-acetylglucosaminyltransferase [Candidatus Polarisedimenticolaceae bacterium]